MKTKKIGYGICTNEEKDSCAKDLVAIIGEDTDDIIIDIYDGEEKLKNLSHLIETCSEQNLCLYCLINTFEFLVSFMGSQKGNILYYIYPNVCIYVYDHPELSTANISGSPLPPAIAMDNANRIIQYMENFKPLGRPSIVINDQFKKLYWEYQRSSKITLGDFAEKLNVSDKTLRKIINRYYLDKSMYIEDLNKEATIHPELIMLKRRGYPNDTPEELSVITEAFVKKALELKVLKYADDYNVALDNLISELLSDNFHILWPVFKKLTTLTNEFSDDISGWIYYIREIPPLFSISTSPDIYQRQMANKIFISLYWQYKNSKNMTIEDVSRELARIKDVPSISTRWVYKKIHEYENSPAYKYDAEKNKDK